MKLTYWPVLWGRLARPFARSPVPRTGRKREKTIGHRPKSTGPFGAGSGPEPTQNPRRKFICFCFIFSFRPQKHKVPTNGPYNWSPELILSVLSIVFRARAVPGAPGACRWPRRAEHRPTNPGPDLSFTFPKVYTVVRRRRLFPGKLLGDKGRPQLRSRPTDGRAYNETAPGTYFSTGFGLTASWGGTNSRLPPAAPKARQAEAGTWSCPRRQGGQNRSTNKSPELSPTVTKVPMQPRRAYRQATLPTPFEFRGFGGGCPSQDFGKEGAT